jgi:hypothetical protein
MAKSGEPHLSRRADELFVRASDSVKALAREMRSGVILNSIFVWEQIRQRRRRPYRIGECTRKYPSVGEFGIRS